MSDQSQRGTGRAYMLSRLRAEHPELAAKVETGELSVYRAALQAGIAAPRFTICGDDPDVMAKTLRRNLSPELIRAIVERLSS